ncbi:hypothetical protein [Paralysiella testudinis]|uniref:Uncharacterized protein n=1 Tax=Paralysiella testudinis TaxID=2809020 RepID=A0A892ZMC2_9NEIS|nr:hypothetical protein [Paralysiella testudinis]QRQ82846.1 hypothetical protein JQU52_05555 [Paralysiella testudinis]
MKSNNSSLGLKLFFFDEYAQACLNSARGSYHLHGLSYPYTDAYLLPFIGWMAVHTNGQAAMPKKNGFGSHRDLPEGLCRWHVFAGDNRCPVYTLADSIAASNEFARQCRQSGSLLGVTGNPMQANRHDEH